MTTFLDLTWMQELGLMLQVIFAALVGGLIGWEREYRGAQAGIRTFGAISMGSCLFVIVSLHIPFPADASRIASQIVIGVGFLGAGIIFRHGDMVMGLTTAATLWCVSAIGVAIGFHMYILATLTTMIIIISLALPRMAWWSKVSVKQKKKRASTKTK